MTEARFDIVFDGTLRPETDPNRARERLGAAFKLDAAGVERLFSGKPMTVKREADAATAARYQRVFEDAGALVTLRPLNAADSESIPASVPAATETAPARPAPIPTPPPPPPAASVPLTAEAGFESLEAPPAAETPNLDLSHLSLVGGSNWSLADCEQRPETIPIPDISHLQLDAIEPTAPEHDKTA